MPDLSGRSGILVIANGFFNRWRKRSIASDVVRMGLFGKHKASVPAMSLEMMEACRDVNGLVQALSSRDGKTVNKAMESLIRIGDPAVDPLIQLCNGRDLDLQVNAAAILGHVKSKKAVPALIKLTYSRDADVRACACLSLGPVDDDRAISALIYRLSDGSKDVRDAAAFSLSSMGDRIIPPVVTCFARANQQLSDASDNLKTVQELGNFDPSVIARISVDKSQLELLQDGIVILISYSDEPWITEFLRCTFFMEKTRDADLALVKKCGPVLFDSLVDLLKSESSDIRLRAVVSLDIFKDENAVEPLEQPLNDDNEAVREAAATALRNIAETGLIVIDRENDKDRVVVTFPCEHCGVPVECGSMYCPSCGALFFDTG